MLTTLFSPVKRSYLLGFFSCALLLLGLLGGHTLFAEGAAAPEWASLPPGHLYTTYPYLAKVQGVEVVKYGRQYSPLDVNGDGLLDWIYKTPSAEYIYLNNGAGWDLVLDCNRVDDIWFGDCAYRNEQLAAAVSAGPTAASGTSCAYNNGEAIWEGDCAFVPH